ncbi:MAG: enoyl-CoA hydratase/isomerase family protein [bacterium]
MALNESELSNEDFTVTVEEENQVIRATIDRPEQKNALNSNVLDGLEETVKAGDKSDAKVLVIRGAGGTFCSGGDLEEGAEIRENSTPPELRDHLSRLADILSAMTDAELLTVAAIEGYCLAGGCGLAAGCDFLVARDDATFGTPEVKVGLFPAMALAPIMRAVQEKKGFKLLFTGEKIDAQEAEQIGLVTDVVPEEDFDDHLEDLVSQLSDTTRNLITMGKESYYTQRDMNYKGALNYLKEIISMVSLSFGS